MQNQLFTKENENHGGYMKFNSTLIASVLYLVCNANAYAENEIQIKQESTATPTNNSELAGKVPTTVFDQKYEDSGIGVFITKVFPSYQMAATQGISTTPRPTGLVLDAIKEAGIPAEVHKVFHIVPSESAIIRFSPIIAGNRAAIKKYAAQQTSRTVIGAISTVGDFLMFRNLSNSTGSVASLDAVKNMSSVGALQSANFEGQKNPEGLPTSPQDNDSIILICSVSIGHNQSENLGESAVYLVIPKTMREEVINGKNLGLLQYGPTVSQVLKRAIMKTANMSPSK
jgi:hypothetical protein